MSSARPYLFISYARDDDETFVERLHGDLTTAEISVWWDRASMQSRGRRFLHEIQEAIQNCDRMLAVIGPRALESEYVRYEWEHALLFGRAVTPILRVGEYDDLAKGVYVRDALGLAEDLSRLHCVDFRRRRPYEDALSELIRLIEAPPAPLGAIHGVPSLPPNFLPRYEPLQSLYDGLLRDVNQAYVITSAKQTSAIHGMGGIGKSVLATAFARSAQVRRVFLDGVFWLPMTRMDDEAALVGAMRRLGQAMGDDIREYVGINRSSDRLTSLLASKSNLIILDDLWHLRQASIFRDVAGPATRLLITTRSASVVNALGAQSYEVDLLTGNQSLALLASWMDLAVSSLPLVARTIVTECGNLPLAIAIVGAILRDNPHRIDYVLRRLTNADLAKLERKLPNYGYPNLLRAMSVSLEALDAETRAVYMGLAVFPPRTPLPEATLACYLESDGYDSYDTQEVVDRLVGRSLVRRVGHRQIQLHDLQYAYVSGLCDDLEGLHRKLVGAYARRCPDGWLHGLDDGYFFQQLPYHLAAMGAHDELHELLLSFDWLKRKLDAVKNAPESAGVSLLIRDFEQALSYQGLSSEVKHRLETIKLVINQSLYALDEGAPLAQQILSRLGEVDPGLAPMLASANGWCHKSWLAPVHASLKRIDGLLRTYHHRMQAVTKIQLLKNDEKVICGSLDMYDNVAIVDLRSGKVDKSFSDEGVKYSDTWDGEAGIVALAVSADERLLLSCAEHESCVKLWDLETGEVVERLKTPGRVKAIVAPEVLDRAISIAGNQLQVWDIASKHCVKRIEGLPSTRMTGDHVVENELESLAVDALGKYAVAGDHEGNLLLFDLEAGCILRHAEAHEAWVSAVSIDTSSGIVLSGSWGASESGIRIWRLSDLSPAGELSDHGPSVNHLALSRDGTLAVSSSRESTAVWDLLERKLVCRHDSHGSWITDLAVAKGRRVIASYIDGSIREWDASVEVGGYRNSATGHRNSISDLAMLGDGCMLASVASNDPDILLWDVGTGTPCGRLTGSGGELSTLMILPDGVTLVAAGKDPTIIGWHLERAEELFRLEARAGDVTSLVHFKQASERLVISGHWNGDVLLWELDRGKLVGVLPRQEADAHWRSHPAEVRSLAVWGERGQLLVGTENSVEIWDVARQKRIHVYWSVLPFDQQEHYTLALHCFQDGRVVSASTDGLLLVRHVESRTRSWNDDLDNIYAYPAADAEGLAASEDGRYLVLATRRNGVRLIDLDSGQDCGVFIGDSWMLACACSVDASVIAAGDAEGNVHVLRHRTSGSGGETRPRDQTPDIPDASKGA